MPIQRRHGWINSGTSTHSRERCHSEKEGGWVLLTDREWFPGIIAEWKRSKCKEYPQYTTSCVRRKGKWEDALAPPNLCKKKYRRDKSETNELGYLQGWAEKDQKGRKRLEGWVQGWGRDTSQRISFCRAVTVGRMLMFPMGKKKIIEEEGKTLKWNMNSDKWANSISNESDEHPERRIRNEPK